MLTESTVDVNCIKNISARKEWEKDSPYIIVGDYVLSRVGNVDLFVKSDKLHRQEGETNKTAPRTQNPRGCFQYVL